MTQKGSKRSYIEKLRDPRWQKKRLEVLEAAGWKCEQCEDDEETLHVHHKIYIKGREPWEYENTQLSCLCQSCHELITRHGDDLDVISSHVGFSAPFCRSDAALLLAGFVGIPYQDALDSTDWEDCPFARGYYETGRQAQLFAPEVVKAEMNKAGEEGK